MQIVAKFHLIGSNSCQNTNSAKELLNYDGELAYTYIDIETTKWLAIILQRSDFNELPIVFDYNYNLIGGLPELKKYLLDDGTSPETNRISALIKKAVDKRSS